MVDPKEEASDTGSKPAEKKPESAGKKLPPWAKKIATKAAKPQVATTTTSGFKGGIKAIEDDIFIYGKGMTAKWLKSKEKLLSYIGNRFTVNEAKSLEMGRVCLTGFDKRDDIVDEDDYKALSFTEKKLYELDLKKYSDAEASVKKNLATCYSLIWSQMDRALRNQVEKHAQYLKAYQEANAPLLYTIMSDICNSSNTVDHYESRYIELLYNLLMCSGKGLTLAEYYEMFNHRVKAAGAGGIDFMSVGLRAELIEKASVLYSGDQAKVDNYIKTKLDKHLTEVKDRILGLIFIKRAGPSYDHCRKDLNNDFVKGNDTFPDTIDEAYAILQNYEVLTSGGKKDAGQSESSGSTKSKTGLSFQQSGDFS